MTNTMTDKEIERLVDELINQKENKQFHDYGLRTMANEYGEANHIALGLPGQYTKLTTTELFTKNNKKNIHIDLTEEVKVDETFKDTIINGVEFHIGRISPEKEITLYPMSLT